MFRRCVFTLLIGLSIFIAGCRTSIPVTDTTAPDLEFTLSGPGIGRETMTNPPRELWSGPENSDHLTLIPNAQYNFTFVVSDHGGVFAAQMQIYNELEITRLTPAEARNEVSGLSRILTASGDRSDPRTGLVISGTFDTTGSSGHSFNIGLLGSDFGGTTGTRNEREMRINLGIDVS